MIYCYLMYMCSKFKKTLYLLISCECVNLEGMQSFEIPKVGRLMSGWWPPSLSYHLDLQRKGGNWGEARIWSVNITKSMLLVTIPHAYTLPWGVAAFAFTSPSDVWHHHQSHQQDATSSHKTPWAKRGLRITNLQWCVLGLFKEILMQEENRQNGAVRSSPWYPSLDRSENSKIIQNDKLTKLNC